MKFISSLVFLLLWLSVSAPAQNRQVYTGDYDYDQLTNQNLDYWVNSPLKLNDAIIFYYKGYARKIRIAGDFNDWKPELAMIQTNTNFWMYVHSGRLNKGTYRYKLVIDDIWTYDPFNTNSLVDNSGQRVSVMELKEDFIPYVRYPLLLEKNVYLFRYESRTARNISLVGDFNNWNPYSHPLVKLGAGEFELKLSLKPGLHTYCYVVDDKWIADYNNLHQYRDRTGAVVSVIYVPAAKR